MNELLLDIHEYVDKMVITYVQKHLNNEASKIALKYQIPHEELMKCLNIKHNLFQNTCCKANTSLGNPCKYKTHNGDEYCLKHKKLRMKENEKK